MKFWFNQKNISIFHRDLGANNMRRLGKTLLQYVASRMFHEINGLEASSVRESRKKLG
jgi:hypothetical protein